MVLNYTEIDELLGRYYLSPFYGIEFCIGFPGNLLVVLGYIFCLPEWQSCNIYLFNLAVSDLIFLCTLPRLSYLYANDQSENSSNACIINRYVLHVNLYSSILSMVWLSMDHFLLIRHPARNHYLLRPRSALSSPHELASCQCGSCSNDSTDDSGPAERKLESLLGLCAFSHQIAHLLHVQERALQRRTTSYKRPLWVVASAAVMFLVLYTPYHVLRNVTIASQEAWAGLQLCTMKYIEGLYILTRPLAFLHSVINPVFYFLMGDKFREFLFAKLRKLRQSGKENQPDKIQHKIPAYCMYKKRHVQCIHA